MRITGKDLHEMATLWNRRGDNRIKIKVISGYGGYAVCEVLSHGHSQLTPFRSSRECYYFLKGMFTGVDMYTHYGHTGSR